MSSARDVLQGPGFARLWRSARRRLERDPGALAEGRTSLRDPTLQERRGIEGLLGRRFGGKTVSVGLAELDAALLLGTGEGLVPWLERMHGRPLRDRSAEEAQAQARREAALAELVGHPLAGERWFAEWVERLRGGRLSRLLGADALDELRVAATVLAALPVDGEAMPVFASRHAGGTKALGRKRRAGRLVLQGLACRAGVPMPENQLEERALWERFGVVLDDLSVSALALNLPAVGQGLLDEHLRSFAGIPVRLTLQQLVQHPPTLDPGATVFVCENPAVVRMAAERLGAGSAPLVATEGHATSAFWRLMGLVGDDVRARADFDADGLRIAGRLMARGARPWRYDAATYREFASENVELPDELPETPWDEELGEAMRGRVRVEEEELLDALLGDLERG